MGEKQGLHRRELNIDWCPVERISFLQEFMNTHWRGGHILAEDADLLRWQHRYAEEPGQISVLVASVGDSLVGMLGIINFGFCLRGKRLPGGWLTQWMAVPEGRSQLVGLHLLQRVLAGGYSVVGTLGSNDKASSIYAAMGFDTWESVPRWVRVTSVQALESLLLGCLNSTLSEDWIASCASTKADHADVDSSVRLVGWSEQVAERWDRAWHEQFAPKLIGTWKDAQYLRWRYIDHPRFNYELRFAETNSTGALRGLLVYRIETVRDRREKVMRVVEFLADEGAGTALAHSIVQTGEESGAAFVDFYCTSSEFTRPLEAVGFLLEDRIPVPLPSLFQPLDTSVTRLTGAFWVTPQLVRDRRSFFGDPMFYITRSDCDQDRPN